MKNQIIQNCSQEINFENVLQVNEYIKNRLIKIFRKVLVALEIIANDNTKTP